MGQSDTRDQAGHGLKALGTIAPGAGLRDAIRQSRVHRARFHAYVAWRVARTERAQAATTASAA